MTATLPLASWTDLLISRSRALADGWTDEEIRARLAGRHWTALRRGQYCSTAELEASTAGRRLHLELLALLRRLHRPETVASGRTAALLHGLLVPDEGAPVLQLTDPHRWRDGRGYRIHRAELPPAEVTALGPFPVTTVARTLVDCARRWPVLDAVAALDDALLRGLVTADGLEAVLVREPTIKGLPAARRAVALSDGRAESWLETAWRVRHTGARLPAPQLQVEIRVAGSLLKVVDGYLPEQAIAIECDGRVKMTDPYRGRAPSTVLWEEKRAEDAVRALGIRVIRLASSDVHRDWAQTAHRIATMVAAPVPVLLPFETHPRTVGRVRPGTQRWAIYRGDEPP